MARDFYYINYGHLKNRIINLLNEDGRIRPRSFMLYTEITLEIIRKYLCPKEDLQEYLLKVKEKAMSDTER